MLPADSLRQLFSDLESDRIGRTASLNDTDKFAKAVTAFANDMRGSGQPGYLLVGVRDNGELSGLRVSDELLLNLSGLRADGNIQPLPGLSVYRHTFQDGEVAVVEVQPSDMPPVRYKGQIWIRVGPRRAIASEQEERILTDRRASAALTFDAQPCRQATLSDLALDLFKVTYLPLAVSGDIIEQNHRDVRLQLASLRFFDLKCDCPTHAGLLLFGKDAKFWLSGAYVQFLRVDGPDLTGEVLMEKELSGDLLTVLRRLDELVELQISKHPVPETALRESAFMDYPVSALRELLMNAVMHRDYRATSPIRFYWFNDSIEIQSPGGLYGEASPGNFPNQTSYRNPVIAEAMKNLGYVNRYGAGIIRARANLLKNGNPPPEFQFDSGYFRARVGIRA